MYLLPIEGGRDPRDGSRQGHSHVTNYCECATDEGRPTCHVTMSVGVLVGSEEVIKEHLRSMLNPPALPTTIVKPLSLHSETVANTTRIASLNWEGFRIPDFAMSKPNEAHGKVIFANFAESAESVKATFCCGGTVYPPATSPTTLWYAKEDGSTGRIVLPFEGDGGGRVDIATVFTT